jgi:hypothetical protein
MQFSRYKERTREGSGTGLSGFKLLAITLKLLKERNQLLIIPITMFLGVDQAFVGADYTAVSVPRRTCTLAVCRSPLLTAVIRVRSQVIWDLWWTKWHKGRFSPSTSLSPANSYYNN